jgi:hypothetical protein
MSITKIKKWYKIVVTKGSEDIDMKKSIGLTILPIAAFVAIVGTGFGTWYFTAADSSSKNASFGYVIEKANSVTDFTAHVSGVLALDQAGFDSNPVQLDINPTLTSTDGVVQSVSTKIDVTIAGGLQNYVYPAEIVPEGSATMTGSDITSKPTAATNAGISYTFFATMANEDTFSVGFNWVTMSSEDGFGKPSTMEQYQIMNASSQTGVLVFTVTLLGFLS